jgi:hypothetical protein
MLWFSQHCYQRYVLYSRPTLDRLPLDFWQSDTYYSRVGEEILHLS